MKIVRKLLQKIFKSFFRQVFKIIHGTIIYDKDNHKLKNITIDLINNKNIINFFNETYKIYNIKHGRIYTDLVESVSIISDNHIIDKVSYQQINGNLVSSDKNIALKNGTPRLKKYFSGRILSLSQGASGHSNYSHWLFDILPKIKLYSEIYKISDLDFIYLNKLNNFQQESLKLLGLEKIKVIDSKKFRHIQGDEIICTDHPSYYKGYILEQAKNIPDWIIIWLRSEYLKNAEPFTCNNKIFIDRTDGAKHCQFINNTEVSEFLIKRGFTVYKLEELNLKKQIYLFNNAKFIIGAHGAGLSNLAFCKKDTKVIEIRPNNHPNTIYERISKINNLDYKLISTDIVSDNNIRGDIYLDTNLLKDI